MSTNRVLPLAPGAPLGRGRYIIDKLIGRGGYVYLARDRRQFQQILLEELAVVQQILESPKAKLLTRKRQHIQTFTRQPAGDVLTDEQVFDADVAYQLVFDGQRWRV